MTKSIKDKLVEVLDGIEKIDEHARGQMWEIENQDLPNVEEMNDSISEAVRALEDISISDDVTRVDDTDIQEIQSKVDSLKLELSEIINELNNPTGLPEQEQFERGHSMLTRSSGYLNHTMLKGINNIANAIMYSSNSTNITYNKFYLLLCTLENQLATVLNDLEVIAKENEIHDLDDLNVSIKIESLRDLAKHKRNYEMEESNG